MGTWGPGILDNDSALDMKETWMENLGEGHSAEDITEFLVNDAKENGILDGEEDELDFWLSLALIQWKTGRLQQIVLEKAKEFLASDRLYEIERQRWEDEELYKKRVRHLKKLEETLNSSQPLARKIPKPFHRESMLKNGDLITFKLNSGKYFLIEIINIEKGHQEEIPTGILYDYYSPIKPQMEVIDTTPVLAVRKVFNSEERWPTEDGKISITYHDSVDHQIILWATSKKFDEPRNRIEIIGNRGEQTFKRTSGFVFLEWRYIDEKLDKWLNGEIEIIDMEKESS